MDYLEVLREKIRRLRVEIAEIQRLNERYQRQDENEADAEAHRKRRERLRAIQHELAQLASFGQKAPSVGEKVKGASLPSESRQEGFVVLSGSTAIE